MHVTITCAHAYLQVCDDSNQASGFAAVGTTVGLGRLMVSFGKG